MHIHIHSVFGSILHVSPYGTRQPEATKSIPYTENYNIYLVRWYDTI